MASHAGAAATIVRMASSGVNPGATDRRVAGPDIVTWLGMQNHRPTEPLAKRELCGAIWDRGTDGEIKQR
eukprot:2095856-Amphidinium_carterae.1